MAELVIALPHGGSVTVQFNPYLVLEPPIIRCVLCANALWVGLCEHTPNPNPKIDAQKIVLTLTLTLTLSLTLSAWAEFVAEVLSTNASGMVCVMI